MKYLVHFNFLIEQIFILEEKIHSNMKKNEKV